MSGIIDMDKSEVKLKFGDFYEVDDNTFKMGIDIRITKIISKRFADMIVLETCTGAGFTTLSLANYAQHVYTVEIDESNQRQAIKNLSKAGLSEKVTFIHGDILNESTLHALPKIDSAFLDPDWADIELNRTYNFRNSCTKPPSDILLDTILKLTPDAALILPPFINKSELESLPSHELQKIILDNEYVLNCLYFGKLVEYLGETEIKINA